MPPRRLPAEASSSRSAGGSDTPPAQVSFRWNGRRLAGQPGDTVASALLAAGHAILTRSPKYHRPRAYLCGVGKCANCLVTIDGKPSQRACMVPLRDGMAVHGQNAWPTPALDVLGVNDLVLKRGFDPQRLLTKPGLLIPWYHRVVRHMAGLGTLPPGSATPGRPADLAQEQVPLAVVGAGPAGLAAAWAASAHGVEVEVFEERPWAGGRLAYEAARLRGPVGFEDQPPSAVLASLQEALGDAEVPVHLGANVAGVYPERLLAVQTSEALWQVRADAVVLAAGAHEVPTPFEDNDRPGIMTLGGAALLLHRHDLLPGNRVVMVGSHDGARALARRFQEVGAKVEALLGPLPPTGEHADLPFLDATPVRAEGNRAVKALQVRQRSDDRILRLTCDLVVLAEPRRPAVELAQQAGCGLVPSGDAFAVPVGRDLRAGPEGVFAAGDLTGPGSVERALAQGRLAGLRAAASLGADVPDKVLEEAEAVLLAMAAFDAPPAAGRTAAAAVTLGGGDAA